MGELPLERTPSYDRQNERLTHSVEIDNSHYNSCSLNSDDRSIDFSSSVQNDLKNLRVLSLNVCGITSRQAYPEFNALLSQFDIIGLQETKTNDLDTFELEGFIFQFKNRKAFSKRKSGGIAIGFRKEISPYINIIQTESRLVYWFTISKRLTRSDDILCGVVYIPPENSDYANDDPYREIQQEIDSFSDKYSTLCIFGDYNSRCKEIKDHIEYDIDILRAQDLNELYQESINEMNEFKRTGSNITLERRNSDRSTNNYGYRFIDFLHFNNLFILNGRTKGDEGGHTTFNNISTIDYFICSTNLFKSIRSLSVLDMCPMVSDLHNPVSLVLNFQYESNNNTEQNNPKTKLWDQGKGNSFIENLNIGEVKNMNSTLDNLQTNISNITQSNINKVADDIANLFTHTAEISFGTVTRKTTKNENVTPSWFGNNCKKARKKFHIAKLQYRLSRTEENKQKLRAEAKEYKSILQKYNLEFKNKNISKLRSLKTANPKTFWKILSGKKNNKVLASLDDCFNHFSKINYDESVDGHTINPENNTQHEQGDNGTPQDSENLNDELNDPITEKEIRKCVKNLKNNKSSGNDNILNEHIKTTLPTMINIYVKLFNIILDTGIVPESWTYGIINPIFKNKGDAFQAQNYRPITLLSCMGKLFTSIIKDRLQAFSDKFNVINEFQAGFRPNYSTVDNIFALHALIQLLHSKKKKLFCAFIDLKGAFDTVWRAGLWSKLLKYNITGKCLTLIQNMYNNIKSSVKVNGIVSNSFPCNIGVRQGESLSPILFSLYLNDLHEFMQNTNLNGIEITL